MPQTNRVDETLRQSIKVEHYRLHCAEQWPDSPYKEAVLVAVHSALKRLEAADIPPRESAVCTVCSTLRAHARVLMFPARPKSSPAVISSAA